MMLIYLSLLLQACRKHIYTENAQSGSTEDSVEKTVITSEGLGKVCEFLINVMSFQSSTGMNSTEIKERNKCLLDEIEVFSKNIMEEDDN